MITLENYSTEVNKIDFSKLETEVVASRDYFEELTNKGKDLTKIYGDETGGLLEFAQAYIEQLNYVLESEPKQKPKKSPRRVTVKTNASETIEQALLESPNFRRVVPKHQQMILVDEHISDVRRIEKEIASIPQLYSQDGLPKNEVTVHAHYFHANSDWFITEFNSETGEMFGYTILNGDSEMSEFGYMPVDQFLNSRSVELDFHWNKVSLAKALYKTDPHYFKKPESTTQTQSSVSKNKAPKKKSAKKTLRKPITRNTKESVSQKKPQQLPPRRLKVNNATKVELVDLELKFIRRYLNMNGKVKTQNQIRLFLNSLQKAIIERRIRKTSKFAKQIMKIQQDLIQILPELRKKSRPIKLVPELVEEYSKLIGKQVERESTKLIKSYVNLQNKYIENKRANSLLARVTRALNNGKITSKDKYFEQIKNVSLNLESFVEKNKRGGFLPVASAELNGIAGNVSSNGLKNTVMRSTDFMRMKFDKLNFQGKWLRFIGNPSPGFSTMIYGMPKTGKSYLMIEFAGYLARNHGSVLYVAKEEELDDTLQEKLRDTEVKHPDLFVSDYLPSDLSGYNFIFLDSVTKMRLSPDDLVQLGKRYPNISFIYVFQATKHGAFRGSNEFQHDVDVVIEVPEKGIARQFGRFNQGATMKIFNN